jgi:N-acetyl-D-muramate 6-phosphate phosphatase
MTLKNKPKAILFDMDGTLCNSITGLHKILNELLKEHHQPPLDINYLRGEIDKGSIEMIALAFGIDENSPEVEVLRQQLLQRYIERMTEVTEFFPNAEKVIEHLRDSAISWGIVTNRPAFLMDPLNNESYFIKQADCLVFGDTLATSKPNPEMLLYACQILNITPQEALYVGDTENDMLAANRANMPCVFAEYGYLRSESNINSLKFNSKITSLKELITLLSDFN